MTVINGTLAPWQRNPITGRFEGGTVWADFSELRHGANVNIVGSGFGSTPQFAFAGGSTGRIEQAAIGLDNVNSGGFFLSYERPKYIVDDAERGKVWRAAVWGGNTANADNGVIVHDWGSPIPTRAKIFLHWQSKINCDAAKYQWKHWRSEATYTIEDGGPESYLMLWKQSNRYYGVRSAVSAGESARTEYVSAYNEIRMDNAWMNLNVYQQLSDEGAANGIVYIDSCSSGYPVRVQKDLSNIQHFAPGVTARPRWNVWQNYLGNYDSGTPTVGEVWMDDLYIQVSAPDADLVRVYLCNTNDFSTSTIREVQRPLSDWNNTNAPVEINRGAMPNGQCWLIVVANKNTQLSAIECQLVD